MTFVITDACVDLMDKSCVPECPVDCIYEGKRVLYINPTECVDCGACEAVCPNDAVFYDMDTPEDQQHWEDIASEWVDEHDATGGAKKKGAVGEDHEAVANVPEKPAD